MALHHAVATRLFDILRTSLITSFDDGANVLAVAQRMGHTDPSVTLRVYGHLFEGVQQELTDRLDQRRQSASRAVEPSTAPVVDLRKHEARRY